MSSSNKPHYDADPEEVKPNQDKTIWTFKPRGFSIIWGNDKRYWNLPEKDSDAAAELVQVCWLELTGTTLEPLPKGTYEIKFDIEMKDGAFGWNGCPIFMMAKIGKKGRYRWTRFILPNDSPNKTVQVPDSNNKFQIVVEAEAPENKLYFGLYEVWTGKWKGGLLIHKATVQKVS